jgi:hypothetical protein
MMVPKCRVLSPVLDTRVLGMCICVYGLEKHRRERGSLSVHRVAYPGYWVARFMNRFNVSREVMLDLGYVRRSGDLW